MPVLDFFDEPAPPSLSSLALRVLGSSLERSDINLPTLARAPRLLRIAAIIAFDTRLAESS